MAIRDTFGSLLSRPAVRALEASVREMVEDILASRRFAAPGDVDALRRELEELKDRQPAAEGELAARFTAMESEIASLKKKLSMAMGALQAATAQLGDAKKAAEDAVATSRQASQLAQSALATAESAVDGAEALEAALAAGSAPAPATVADAAAGKADVCSIPGCGGKVRAKGYCAKHYQQWKRGTLDVAGA